MIIHDVEQGSLEWLALRAGIPTASEFDALLTPEFKIRTGEGLKTYLAKKVAEAWQGGPLESFDSFAMEQGAILESESRNWFELEYDTAIQKVGFITTQDKRAGCSPDGLLDADCGLELKCPAIHTHVRYLLNGTLPKEYAAQVHGSMFVTGFTKWKFVSYQRHCPKFVLTIERDETIQERIAAALERFHDAFDKAMERLTAINGGPPRRLTRPEYTPKPQPNPTRDQPQELPQDLIP